MSKKILALLLSLMMILSQSTMCFGEVLAGDEGADPVLESITAEPSELKVPVAYTDEAVIEKFVKNNIVVKALFDDESTQTVKKENYTVTFGENLATITYSEKSCDVTLVPEAGTTDPIVLDFESDMGGMTAKDWVAGNVLDLSLENGALKCDYTYTGGERSYIYLPLNHIDGAYYDTIKVKAKVENVEGTPGNFVMYFMGSDKTNADYTGESSNTRKSFTYANTTESDGLSSNSEYQEYIIDLTNNEHWKNLYVSKIRIDGLHNKSGIVYIDSIELYNKELHTVKEPINFEFETGLDGVTTSSSTGITAVAEGGVLKGTISDYEKYLYVPLNSIDGSYYNALEFRAKVNSAVTTEKAQAKNAFFGFFFEGTDKITGEKVNFAGGARQKNIYMTEMIEQQDGSYKNTQFQTYTINYDEVSLWADTNVTRLRIDVLKNLYGEFEIDYIRLYHKEEAPAPTLTGIEVAPSTLTVPYANQNDILGFVEDAITSVTATYSDGSTEAVTGYTVAVDGTTATVTYEGLSDTIALTLESAPAPSSEPVWDFESGMSGITVKNYSPNVMTATVENGNLKCDFSYTSGERSYLYIALDDIDGAYYDTLKIRAKIASVNTATQTLRMFFTGEDKTTQEAYSESGARGKNVAYAALTENNGVYSHSDYTEYEIDLSAISKWSDSYISRVRIDALANATGVLYIDSIGFYHKEAAPELTGIEVSPETLSVPYANQADIIGFVRGAITGVTATYSDGSSALVTGYEVAINGEVATVTYEGMTDTIALTLEDAPIVTPELTGIVVLPETLTVPYANQADILGFVRGAITGVTATYSDGSSAPVTQGYTVAINGEVATVTYEGMTDTIALTLEQEPSNPPAPSYEFEFESGLDGVTASSTSGITIIAEDGKLKGTMTGNEKYLFVPVDGIDTSYYDGIKISIKVTNAVDTTWDSTTWLAKNAQFSFFFEGTDKATGNKVNFAGGSSKNIYVKELAQQPDGSYMNAEAVEYIIDFSAINGWTSTNATKLRIDPIRHLNGTFEIDYIKFYHKEVETIEVAPAAMEVPETESDVENYVKSRISSLTAIYNDGTTAVVTTGYTVAVDGEVATVTYEGKTATIALTYVEEVVPPAPSSSIIFGFDTGLDGITSSNNTKLSLSVADGVLTGTLTDREVYMFVPLNNIDGSYYNTLKIRVKAEEARDNVDSLAKNANITMYFKGVSKIDGSDLNYTSARRKGFYLSGLVENNGVWSNADYVEYVVDLSALTDWSDAIVTQLRIDPLKNLLGTFKIDYIEIYHKELTGITVAPSAMEVPLSQQATAADYVKSHISSVIAVYNDGSEIEAEDYTVTVEDNTATVTYMDKTATIALTFVEEVIPPTPDDEVAEGEEFILYDFNEGTDGFTESGDVTISQIVTDDGITALEYISSVDTAAGKTETGFIAKNVNYNPGQVYKIEMRVKFVGVTPVFGTGTSPAYNVIYAGSIDGKEFVGDSHHQITGTYSDIELTEGEYWSKDGDWHIVTIDPTKANGTKTKSDGTVVEVNWGKSIIEQIRFDILKKSNGIVLVDYIKMYSVPSVTDIVFDNGGISASAVPVGTEKITLTLSDSLYEVKKNAVSVVSADGVSVEIKSVSHEKSTNKVVITVGELESMTDYAVLINSNALANERQSLYKAIKATFTTEKGELECSAAGDGNSAEFTFVNAGESKNVVLVATVWDGDKYVGKYTQPYQIAAGDSTYTFNYSSVLGGDRAEVTVWDYADGTVKTVYGKKVFTFDR